MTSGKAPCRGVLKSGKSSLVVEVIFVLHREIRAYLGKHDVNEISLKSARDVRGERKILYLTCSPVFFLFLLICFVKGGQRLKKKGQYRVSVYRMHFLFAAGWKVGYSTFFSMLILQLHLRACRSINRREWRDGMRFAFSFERSVKFN